MGREVGQRVRAAKTKLNKARHALLGQPPHLGRLAAAQAPSDIALAIATPPAVVVDAPRSVSVDSSELSVAAEEAEATAEE